MSNRDGVPGRIWRSHSWNRKTCNALAAELGIPPQLVAILLQRKLENAEQIHSFLNPTLDQLPSPFLMQGMQQAVDILGNAIQNRDPIFLYGDYDVDGTTSVAVLHLFFKITGTPVFCYQPDRLKDGYGLHSDSLKKFLPRRKRGVLITADCGITDIEEVKEAKSRGFSVIITDHHLPPAVLPMADAILNPRQPECSFPFKQLAGVGVAFYLIMGLRTHLTRQGYWTRQEAPNIKQFLDLVALGTVSDMAPLTGTNRVLVKAGLEVLNDTPRPGIEKLLKVANINDRNILSEDISFQIGPRINAAGRIGGDPSRALNLLISDDLEKAGELALSLDKDNIIRKSLVEELFARATKEADKAMRENAMALVLAGDDWHPGVIGIVASRLAGQYHRPVILLSIQGDTAKGSGRSIPGFHLHEALEECADWFEQFGGHRNAAGMTLQKKHIGRFREQFEKVVARKITEENLQPVLWVDWLIEDITLFSRQFLRQYLRLAPFGIGNPEPVFGTAQAVKLANAQLIGSDHLRFALKSNGVQLNGIGFGFGHLVKTLQDRQAKLAFALRQNVFRGRKQWQVHAIDFFEEPGG